MNYIIFDLEATCWGYNETIPGKQEIIEIGAVKLNNNGEQVSHFEQFVKPVNFPFLSEFCKQLTTIEQFQVDNAPNFPKAISNFKDWIDLEDDYLLISWGDWDKYQLINESKRHKLEQDWVKKHVNLKEEYRKLKLMRKAPGMKKALIKENIQLAGTHHRGIDDAYNITKLFQRYFSLWKFKRFNC